MGSGPKGVVNVQAGWSGPTKLDDFNLPPS